MGHHRLMGYYTRFKVDFKHVGDPDPHMPFFPADGAEAHVSALNRLTRYGPEFFGKDGWSHDTLKWYDWETDMMDASSQMPGVLITLTGSGEDDGDIWRAYFLDGRVQCERPAIRFEPFDPAKLRDRPHMPSRNQANIWE